MNCPACGKELRDGARFCTGCGAGLSGPGAASASRVGVPAPPPAPSARRVPPPARGQDPECDHDAPGVPVPPVVSPGVRDQHAPEVDFTVPEIPGRTPVWQRVPSNVRKAAILAVGLVFAAGLFFLVRYIALGGGRLEPVSSTYIKPGAGYIIEMPRKGWYAVTRQPAGSLVIGEFYRGWFRSAPVTLRIFSTQISTRMPRRFNEESANLLEPYFIKRTERILVQDGQGFELGKVSVIPDMGLRDGVMLEGKAVPTDAAPVPAILVFVFSGNRELVLLFTIPGENPAQYKKEILEITKSFRAD